MRDHSTLPPQFLKNLCKQALLDSPTYSIDKFAAESKMDQNEMPWDWPLEFKEGACELLKQTPWNRYPDAHSGELGGLLAEFLNLPESCLLTASGSDSILTMLLRGFGNHRVVGLDPSFPVTKMQAGVHGLSFTPWPLDQNFAFDLAALPRLDPGSLVIFASPNNPTGSVLPAKDIEKLVQEHPQCLFVADEAYAEFHEDHLLSLVEKHPNLVSMRTMSKAWASAGVRFGYLLGDPAIIAELKKFRLPYAINAFCSSAVRYYLGNKALQLWSKQKVQEVKSLTQSFLSEVSTIGREAGWRVYPTAANFFLVSFESTEHIPALYDYLKEHGTLVRNVSKAKGLEKCLRFSCGTPEQVTRTVALLKTFVSELSR